MRLVRHLAVLCLLTAIGTALAACQATSQVDDARNVVGEARYAVGVTAPIGSYSTAVLEADDPALIQGAATPEAADAYARISREVSDAANDMAALKPPPDVRADHDAVVASMRRVSRRLANASRYARAGKQAKVVNAMGRLQDDEQRVADALTRLSEHHVVSVQKLAGTLAGEH